MSSEGWLALAELADRITTAGLALIIIVALVRRIVITRGTHDDMLKLKDEIIAELREERDEAIAGWKAQTEATNKLAAAVGTLRGAVERLSTRHRRYDADGGPSERGPKE